MTYIVKSASSLSNNYTATFLMTSSSFDIENPALSLFDVYSKVSILVILDGKCSGDQKCPYTKMNIYGQIKTNIHGHVNRYSHVRALYSREFT